MHKPMLLGLVVLLSGCLSAHRVRIESNPPGAIVSIRGQELGPTPLELTTLYFPMRWYSFGQSTDDGWRGGRTSVRLEAPGHRSGRVRMGQGAGRVVLADWLLFWAPDRFNGPAPWQWRWGHLGRLIGVTPRYTHTVQLIREHKRAGGWTPEDAERMK
ncbi:MAG: hypothetical protein ACI8S6_003906 [Myxococcota bacterium]|jgi:hypothetical protein